MRGKTLATESIENTEIDHHRREQGGRVPSVVSVPSVAKEFF
jgi:hypothetical protein